jgi:predicted oxidoreductase
MKTNFSKLIAGVMKWGVWGAKFSTQDYVQMMEACLQAGVTSFDHADIYGHYTTEAEFGQALANRPQLRSQMQLITKCGIQALTPNRPDNQIKYYNTSKEYIIASAEQSLKNLQTDYLDALLIHRPDPLMKGEEIAAAFDHLKQSGKILHAGVSNFTTSQVDMLMKFCSVDINQIECSVVNMKAMYNGVLDQCQAQNILPMAWSPLGGGKLFGGVDERNMRLEAVCQILGEKYALNENQILLSWLMMHPSNMLPVLGTTKPARWQELKNANKDILTREEWFMIWRASTGEEVA